MTTDKYAVYGYFTDKGFLVPKSAWSKIGETPPLLGAPPPVPSLNENTKTTHGKKAKHQKFVFARQVKFITFNSYDYLTSTLDNAFPPPLPYYESDDDNNDDDDETPPPPPPYENEEDDEIPPPPPYEDDEIPPPPPPPYDDDEIPPPPPPLNESE